MIEQPQKPTLPIHGVMPRFSSVLSLFDGMSCGQIALNRVGIKYDNYFASEIDKHAIKVTQANYPNTIQLGDITKVKVKLLCLLEVYSYICNYDSNLQSNISEWEVLYWLDKNFTLSAKIGTQKPNERQEVSESSTIQRIKEIWFSNREMGSIRKFGYDTRGRNIGKENDIRTPQQLQCGEWWYDNDVYKRYKEENIRIPNRKTKNRYSEKENFGNVKEPVFKREESEVCFGENEKGNVERRCSRELLEGEGENRLSREVEKENRDGRAEEISFINKIVGELCRWNETNGITQNYWNILRLHKEEQVTVVEYEGGFYIFKGRIDLCIGGSPCQGFSFAGKGLNFDDPRSKLFFEFVRLKNETQPKYWLLENVKMKSEHQNVISDILGVKPILINSELVSAQSRERLYWTNIPIAELPTDKGILLKDIIENGFIDRNKSYCIDANYWKGGNFTQYYTKARRQLVFKDKAQTILSTIYKENAKSMMQRKKLGLVVSDGEYARKLTPKECERLQTVPDNYTNCVSDTQRYKMLGNGWTVDIIAHIFGSLLNGA